MIIPLPSPGIVKILLHKENFLELNFIINYINIPQISI
jgi:hypothetical protein